MNYPENILQTYDEQGTTADLKIVFVLREPVSREISYYNFLVDRALRNDQNAFVQHVVHPDGGVRTIDDYFNREILSWGEHAHNTTTSRHSFQFSRYGSLLQRWFHLFDRQQILILSFDELHTNGTAFTERICQFLNISVPEKSLKKKLPGKSSAVPTCAMQERLADLFRPINEELYDLLEQNPGPEMEQRPFPKFERRPCSDRV